MLGPLWSAVSSGWGCWILGKTPLPGVLGCPGAPSKYGLGLGAPCRMSAAILSLPTWPCLERVPGFLREVLALPRLLGPPGKPPWSDDLGRVVLARVSRAEIVGRHASASAREPPSAPVFCGGVVLISKLGTPNLGIRYPRFWLPIRGQKWVRKSCLSGAAFCSENAARSSAVLGCENCARMVRSWQTYPGLGGLFSGSGMLKFEAPKRT